MNRVSEAWSRMSATATLADRMAAVHKELHEWDRKVLKSPQRRLKKLKEELKTLRLGPLTDESADR